MMSDYNFIQREQEFVNRALKVRENRRKVRDSGKYSLAHALINPVNTMAGHVALSLGDLWTWRGFSWHLLVNLAIVSP